MLKNKEADSLLRRRLNLQINYCSCATFLFGPANCSLLVLILRLFKKAVYEGQDNVVKLPPQLITI